MDKACCPGCDAEIGPANKSLPIQCAKCGIFFGNRASNKPIIRPALHDPRASLLRFVGCLLAPALVYWVDGRFGYELLGWLPSIPGAWTVKFLSLLAFGFACAAYGVTWLMNYDGGVGWLIAFAAFIIINLFNVYLFIGL